ncbi:MAG: translation elongation factor Ts [Holosporales bacterium]|jgi:elongation factor Ts|nr:translation elongation factor Ts [Holosporales bacterium]
MEISAQLVKQLRDKTGAGMMDCKKALIESGGNLASAEEFLRKKGLMDAAKKASRVAADGLVAIAISDDEKVAAIVEVNSETDFVARNEKFQKLVLEIAKIALVSDSIIDFTSSTGKTIKEEIDTLISIIGENITLRRARRLSVENGIVSQYTHNAIANNMGKIGVLVAIETDGEFCQEKLSAFGKKIAMHVAAANPTYKCTKCVPQDVIDKEKEIVLAQAKELEKPINIAEKMAEGRIKKFHEECTLTEQIFVMDGRTKISEVVRTFGEENRIDVNIADFSKFVLGEGLEKN